MNLVDLHVHSTFSDGILSPYEILDYVVKSGIPGFSLTDHDTFDGAEIVLEYLKKNNLKDKIFFIPGCEFSSYKKDFGEVHLIGYFENNKCREMKDFTKEFQVQRINRARKIIECLKQNGYELNENEIFDDYRTIGRLNIARNLVRKGFFKDIGEVFEKILSEGAPCYFKKKEVSPEEIIKRITENNGKAVLAHPTYLLSRKNWNFLNDWIRIGLWGIECYHPKVNRTLADEIMKNLKGALVFTGGSDYHGDDLNIFIGKFGITLENALEIFC